LRSAITHLIVNSPYDEPKHHGHFHRETRNFSLNAVRRPAGCVLASESSKAFDDSGRFIPIKLVNRIRPRAQAWRDGGCAGVASGVRFNPSDLLTVIHKADSSKPL
jgi:type III restriction enzyme